MRELTIASRGCSKRRVTSSLSDADERDRVTFVEQHHVRARQEIRTPLLSTAQQTNHGVAGGEIVRISLTKIKISPEKKLYLRILEFEDTMIFHN